MENDLVQESLVKETAACDNVVVKYGSKVVNYQFPDHLEEQMSVTLEDGSRNSASLVVRQYFGIYSIMNDVFQSS